MFDQRPVRECEVEVEVEVHCTLRLLLNACILLYPGVPPCLTVQRSGVCRGLPCSRVRVVVVSECNPRPRGVCCR